MLTNKLLNQKMPSLTEWLEKIKFPNILEFRNEDNNKYERLKILCKILPIHYNIPKKINITDIINNTLTFRNIFTKKQHLICNWRIIPKKPNYPKLRIRAVTFEEAYKWFKEQNINPDYYKEVEIIKYNNNTTYSAIFLINNLGVWGEIIQGDLWQLAYGIHKIQPLIFTFDYNNLFISSPNRQADGIIKKAIESLRTKSIEQQERLRETLNAEFTEQGYLKGYFEFVIWPNEEMLFMDYNRTVYKMLGDYNFLPSTQGGFLTGICANPGATQGYVQLITDPNKESFIQNHILVCQLTTIDYLPLMKKAKAIIIEQGNILSHASIISRELNKPCLVGVKNVLKYLKNDDHVIVDATKGIIIKLSKLKIPSVI